MRHIELTPKRLDFSVIRNNMDFHVATLEINISLVPMDITPDAAAIFYLGFGQLHFNCYIGFSVVELLSMEGSLSIVVIPRDCILGCCWFHFCQVCSVAIDSVAVFLFRFEYFATF